MRGRRGMLMWMLVTLLSCLPACRRESAEDALRERIADLERAVQARDAGELRGFLADDFVGNDGMDREGAVRLAQISFLRYRRIGVVLGPLQVELHERRATVRGSAMLTGGEGALPGSAQAYDVVTGWRLEDGEWRLVSAAWEPRL